jgi:hypothetical protein
VVPLRLLVLAAAWLGHAFALTVLLNVVYSRPLPRRFQRSFRLFVAGAVFAFPLLVWWTTGGRLWEPAAVGAYVALCLFVGVIALPVLTLRRLLRRPPDELLRESSRVVDVAKDLGGRPLGYGKHWRLARLPGNQLLEVDFTERTLRLPRLPAAWDGLTILHLSDLHFHGTPERPFFEHAFDIAAAAGPPDLLCLTGDVIDAVAHLRWIKPLLRRLPWREAGLAILGNHDYWCAADGVRRQLGRAGLTVLGNRWRQLTIRGEPLVAIGHEGPWFRPEPDLTAAPRGPFRLLLSHTPDNIRWARNANVDLMLSGHVHGGQVRVPVLGSLFVPSQYSRKYDQGVFLEPPTLLHVSRGVSGREPLRWNCRPEITRVVLVRG